MPPPGELPLVDFLLRTHAGYCQHFAGAAALLLRMAGVPSRMVTGFATGVRTERGFVVRDVDAHAWIEVYFEDLGWVPFDPTPPSADAAVARELDPLAATRKPGGPGGSLAIAVAVAVAAAALAGRAASATPDAGAGARTARRAERHADPPVHDAWRAARRARAQRGSPHLRPRRRGGARPLRPASAAPLDVPTHASRASARTRRRAVARRAAGPGGALPDHAAGAMTAHTAVVEIAPRRASEPREAQRRHAGGSILETPKRR